eukprot:Selendium_serpulae@DN5064_c1_g1_i1.p1
MYKLMEEEHRRKVSLLSVYRVRQSTPCPSDIVVSSFVASQSVVGVPWRSGVARRVGLSCVAQSANLYTEIKKNKRHQNKHQRKANNPLLRKTKGCLSRAASIRWTDVALRRCA